MHVFNWLKYPIWDFKILHIFFCHFPFDSHVAIWMVNEQKMLVSQPLFYNSIFVIIAAFYEQIDVISPIFSREVDIVSIYMTYTLFNSFLKIISIDTSLTII